MPFDDFTFSPVTVAAPATPVLLPHVPSALIRLALADLEKVERTPGYRVDMGVWHYPSDDTCAVCFAGAVMAFSCKAIRSDALSAVDFGVHNEAAFEALDLFRCGDQWCIDEASRVLCVMTIRVPKPIPAYHRNRPGFHRAMHALADAFELSANDPLTPDEDRPSPGRPAGAATIPEPVMSDPTNTPLRIQLNSLAASLSTDFRFADDAVLAALALSYAGSLLIASQAEVVETVRAKDGDAFDWNKEMVG